MNSNNKIENCIHTEICEGGCDDCNFAGTRKPEELKEETVEKAENILSEMEVSRNQDLLKSQVQEKANLLKERFNSDLKRFYIPFISKIFEDNNIKYDAEEYLNEMINDNPYLTSCIIESLGGVNNLAINYIHLCLEEDFGISNYVLRKRV